VSLVTRCPSCATAFRVLPTQLVARAGSVRCGKCGSVFDGLAALVEQAQAPLRLEPSPQLNVLDPARPPAVAGAPRDATAPLPAFLSEPRAPRRALWWTLTAVALLALAAQAIYHFRSEIAVSLPATRAPLEAACRVLNCQVPLPRLLGLLSIDSYELHQDPRGEGLIVLNAVIRNRAPFPQQYPSLHLTLTDGAAGPVASRVLAPRDYLDRARAPQLIARGMEAGGEASLTVYFDASRARASGYELVLFYPS
jgi:predicted Zn finger-like uncharacterized protein